MTFFSTATRPQKSGFGGSEGGWAGTVQGGSTAEAAYARAGLEIRPFKVGNLLLQLLKVALQHLSFLGQPHYFGPRAWQRLRSTAYFRRTTRHRLVGSPYPPPTTYFQSAAATTPPQDQGLLL